MERLLTACMFAGYSRFAEETIWTLDRRRRTDESYLIDDREIDCLDSAKLTSETEGTFMAYLRLWFAQAVRFVGLLTGLNAIFTWQLEWTFQRLKRAAYDEDPWGYLWAEVIKNCATEPQLLIGSTRGSDVKMLLDRARLSAKSQTSAASGVLPPAAPLKQPRLDSLDSFEGVEPNTHALVLYPETEHCLRYGTLADRDENEDQAVEWWEFGHSLPLTGEIAATLARFKMSHSQLVH